MTTTPLTTTAHDPDLTDVAVLVPVLNEEAHIRTTVAGLQAQDHRGRLEFWFLDGGSTDRTVQILEHLALSDRRIKVAPNPGRVPPSALNLGLRLSESDYVARFDAHATYPPGYVRIGIERLQRGDVASVSGPQVAEGSSGWTRRVALALSTKLGTGEASFRHAVSTETEVDSGFTGMWSRPTLEALGGWDEDAYPNEDAEFAARVRGAGGRIVCLPEMAAVYSPRSDLPSLARQYWRYGQYRARTAVRHPDSMRRSHTLAPATCCAAVLSLTRVPVLARAARIGMLVYAATLVAVSVRQLGRARRDDAAWLPVVFAVMHLSWGFGFLRGMTRFGVPGAALRRILGDALAPARTP